MKKIFSFLGYEVRKKSKKFKLDFYQGVLETFMHLQDLDKMNIVQVGAHNGLHLKRKGSHVKLEKYLASNGYNIIHWSEKDSVAFWI